MKIKILMILCSLGLASCWRSKKSQLSVVHFDSLVAEEYKRDSLFYEVFKKIDYEQYRNKTIGDLLKNDSINHFSIIRFTPKNGECLSSIEIACGYQVFLSIHLPDETKYVQKCLTFSLWKMEDVKKERIEKVVVSRMFPQQSVVLFDRKRP
jgi:hypothetical protein